MLDHTSSLQSSFDVSFYDTWLLFWVALLSSFSHRYNSLRQCLPAISVCERVCVIVGQLVSCRLAEGLCSHLNPPPTLPEKRSVCSCGTLSIGACACCRTTLPPPPPPRNSSGCCDSGRQQDLGLHLGFLCQETAVSLFPPSQDPLLLCTLLGGQSDGFVYPSLSLNNQGGPMTHRCNHFLQYVYKYIIV